MRSLMTLSDRLLADPWFSASWTPMWSRGAASTWPVNVFENGDAYHIYALVPGVDPDQLQITVHPEGHVTIAGEVKPTFPADAKAIWTEFGTQQFRRDVSLPAAFDADEAKTTYANGVLEVVLPKKAEARARQIKVSVSK